MMKIPCLILLLLWFSAGLQATKLISVSPVDSRCLVLHWQDGYIEYNWDDTLSGSCNGWDYFHTENWHLCSDKDQYVAYGDPLDIDISTYVTSYSLSSFTDEIYTGEGKNPVKVHRKSKVWEASHDERVPAMHHWIYLELPSDLKRGMKYELSIDDGTGSDRTRISFLFNEFGQVSPSIRVSNTGYENTAPRKMADVYMWMGDGGGRDFSQLEGNPWHLVNTATGRIEESGVLNFYMKHGPDPLKEGADITMADIWESDFSDFRGEGEYRLVVEGLGCSETFIIGTNRFEEPFKVSMQGMFYQRMGCVDPPAGGFPKSRRPLYRQGMESQNFVVKISNREMITGVNPDNQGWYAEDLSGEILRESWGGWSDAYDNDQRPSNYICVFDILLTYYLNPAAFSDGQLYIPETGNGIPDILDEALWEIDWWLRMRDSEGGYLSGLTNIKPPHDTVNYAGAACGWQGWCVAAGTAMAADCFRLGGQIELKEKYLKEAEKAYEWASEQKDPMLDTDVSGLRGRDLKMTAAAFLFNLTGKKKYEEVVEEETMVKDEQSRIRNIGEWEQQFATTAYILSPQKVNDPDLQSTMKNAMINQAKRDYVDRMDLSPVRAIRWGGSWDGIFMSSSEVSVVAIAHRLTEKESTRKYLEKGLYSEAEWTLGRNPLGLVLMTGLTDRCVTQTFAPGRRDGHAGLTPGWTPYMMRDGWKNADDIHRCEWYTNRNYPEDKEVWPWGEHFWNSRYCVPNSESTPQQNYRQKILLYGYLFGIAN